jgi:hypothetical protein
LGVLIKKKKKKASSNQKGREILEARIEYLTQDALQHFVSAKFLVGGQIDLAITLK